jgi:protein-S-isoprenylcysteine O-methyltransferase Ste14
MAAIILGLGFLFYGMVVLGLLPSIGRGRKGLTQSGIYRNTRNPQALACGLYVVGFTVLWPSWYAVGWAILNAILIHTMIITEEEHLLRAYGEGYAKYCRDVPRYFSLSSWISPETTI